MSKFVLTEEEFQEAVDGYEGICKECGERRSGCEPDAEDYECESCGANAVQGIENALICGTIDIS